MIVYENLTKVFRSFPHTTLVIPKMTDHSLQNISLYLKDTTMIFFSVPISINEISNSSGKGQILIFPFLYKLETFSFVRKRKSSLL